MDALGTVQNPVHVRRMDDKGKIVSMAVSLATVTMIMLMQNPGLRQALRMRLCYFGMKLCARNVAYWKRMETIAEHSYDVARL